MEKCPRCGFTQTTKAYGKDIRQYLSKFSRLTRQLLRKASSSIMTNIPSDNNQYKYLRFLQVIIDVDENVVRRVLKQYLDSNYAASGKGFAYLQSIILKENQNKVTKLSNEYKISGRSPSFDLMEDKSSGT